MMFYCQLYRKMIKFVIIFPWWFKWQISENSIALKIFLTYCHNMDMPFALQKAFFFFFSFIHLILTLSMLSIFSNKECLPFKELLLTECVYTIRFSFMFEYHMQLQISFVSLGTLLKCLVQVCSRIWLFSKCIYPVIP